MSEQLRIYNVAADVTTLGPGRRFVIWTQGCPRSCPGCVAPETQDARGGRLVDVDTLAEGILRLSDIEGVTISGGEPFLQCEALCELLDRLRARRDLGAIVYTGYTVEELRGMNSEPVNALLARVDLLIDGPYVEALNDDRGLRGSSNQRAIHLTPRYEGKLEDFGRAGARKLEFRLTESGFLLAGIPEAHQLAQLKPKREAEDE